MANRLYLLEPVIEEKDIYEIVEDETDEIKDLNQKEALYEKKTIESISSRKSLSSQGSSLYERLDVHKVNTKDTDLNKTNKDWKNQNDLLISGIDKNNQDIVTNS